MVAPETPGNVATASEALAAARTGRLVRGVGSSLVARGVTSLVPLVLIPITLGYLGAETYGIWMALTSVTSMFLWADLGLGNTLMTRLTPLIVKGDWAEARDLVSAAYRVLGRVALVGMVAVAIASLLLPWDAILNAPDSEEPRWVAGVCLLAFVINIPLSLVHRLLFALQRVPASNGLQMGGSCLAVAAGGLAVIGDAAPVLVIALIVLAPVAVNALGTVVTLKGSGLVSSAALRDASSKGLITSGLRFVLIGVMTSLALNVDFLVVAHGTGVKDVALYSVVTRLFLALGLLVTVLNMPLWPANSEALVRGDLAWVRRSTGWMMLLSGGGVLLSGAVLVLAKDPILQILGAHDSTLSTTLPLGFVAMWTLLAITSPLFMVQNSVGHLGPQTIGWAAYLIVSVPAKVLVVHNIGSDWIPWTSLVVYAITVFPSAVIGLRGALRATGRRTRTFQGVGG
ncbi:lipopolysaccharide biosynthesis protein [Ornithinimicrobium cerasi]|uniref:lipopolysaccharide biosynthesis protein n=1 Tax=Ornithinimicrobium cerasi TaxID=2248773 RepID=UPI001EFFC8D9|nr:oligosaccharide flippase family protein [Ornithinimicrobium cerasi]